MLLFDQDGGLVVLAEVINKDCGAERYAALFRRYDPPVADIPDEDVAAIWCPLTYTSIALNGSPGKAMSPASPCAKQAATRKEERP